MPSRHKARLQHQRRDGKEKKGKGRGEEGKGEEGKTEEKRRRKDGKGIREKIKRKESLLGE